AEPDPLRRSNSESMRCAERALRHGEDEPSGPGRALAPMPAFERRGAPAGFGSRLGLGADSWSPPGISRDRWSSAATLGRRFGDSTAWAPRMCGTRAGAQYRPWLSTQPGAASPLGTGPHHPRLLATSTSPRRPSVGLELGGRLGRRLRAG